MPPKRIESIKELKSVYFLYGDEELLMEDALKRLKFILAREVDEFFNMEVLDAASVGADRVIDAAETIPLMSERRLVIAREVNRLSRKDQEKLSLYLKNPNTATTLVLVAHFPSAGEKRDNAALKKMEGTALFKAAMAAGDVLKLTLGPKGRHQKVDKWVSEQFKKRGKSVEPDAEGALLEKVGRELRDLGDAIERICLFTADKDVVTKKDVLQVVIPAAEQGIFELVDSVAGRRRDVSLYLFNQLMRQGESPQRVFNMLLRQFRLIARVKALLQDHNYQEIASRVGIPPFLVGKCAEQAKRFSSDRLRGIFLELRDAQEELHSSKYLSEREYQSCILEMLVLKIIG